MYKNIGKIISERRKELKISADELAYMVGKNRATIYRYENGDIYSMPFNTFFLICDILGLNPNELLGWTNTEERLSKYARMISDLDLNESEIEQIIQYATFIRNNRTDN